MIATIGAWGRKFQKEEQRKQLVFLDQKKQAFEWDNDELDEVGPDEDIPHPEIPDKIPGIEVADDNSYDNGVIDILQPSPEELVQAAVECTKLVGNANTTGVTTAVNLVDGGDDDDNPPELETQECVPTTENVSANDVEDDINFLGNVEEDQDNIYGPGNNDTSLVAVNPPAPMSDDVTNVQRSTKNRIPQAMYRADFSNQQYKDENHVTGIIHINVEDTPHYDLRKTCYEDIMSHILGVMLIQQFSLKAGLKRFGPKGIVAATKECK